MLDRFRYGADDSIIGDMLNNRRDLFNQARDYVYQKLKDSGVVIPEDIVIEMPPLIKKFDIFNLIST